MENENKHTKLTSFKIARRKSVLFILTPIALLLFVLGYWLYQKSLKIPVPIPGPQSGQSSVNNNGTLDDKNLMNHYQGVDCSKLSGTTVRPGDDIVELKKSVCAAERAWFENNPDFCKLHSDPDHCYGWMAIKTGDLSLCRVKTKKTGYFYITDQLKESERNNAWLYDCYRATANWRNESEICDMIPYKDDSLLQSCKKTTTDWTTHYSMYKETSPI